MLLSLPPAKPEKLEAYCDTLPTEWEKAQAIGMDRSGFPWPRWTMVCNETGCFAMARTCDGRAITFLHICMQSKKAIPARDADLRSDGRSCPNWLQMPVKLRCSATIFVFLSNRIVSADHHPDPLYPLWCEAGRVAAIIQSYSLAYSRLPSYLPAPSSSPSSRLTYRRLGGRPARLCENPR